MTERYEKLEALLEANNIAQAMEMLKAPNGYREGEKFVYVALNHKHSSPEIVETAMVSFEKTRENIFDKHGYWVHSLSHFTKVLWRRRMDTWIKKFYEMSFRGARELGNNSCCNRLVDDFAEYAKWNDDPVDFFLNEENIALVDLEYYTYARARIRAGRFQSEEVFLRWKIARPESQTTWSNEDQAHLVDLEKVRALIEDLRKVGANVQEFDSNFERNLLVEHLRRQQEALTTAKDWQRSELEKSIQKTNEVLASY